METVCYVCKKTLAFCTVKFHDTITPLDGDFRGFHNLDNWGVRDSDASHYVPGAEPAQAIPFGHAIELNPPSALEWGAGSVAALQPIGRTR